MVLYKGNFYSKRNEKTIISSKKILKIVYEILGQSTIRNVIDVGCGVGVWLKFCEKKGAKTIGIEGEWLPKNLYVADGKLITSDLSKTLPNLNKKFDLCISLEVAEHLPKIRANRFVYELTKYSNIILFSAAVPGQGGRGHINEQPLSYWIKLFNNNNYEMFDVIRPVVWGDKDIPVWYRQNTVLFINKNYLKKTNKLITNKLSSKKSLVDAIHPELFEDYRYPRLYIALANIISFPLSIWRTIKHKHRKKNES
jgi:SAM-dependent methyltransferase